MYQPVRRLNGSVLGRAQYLCVLVLQRVGSHSEARQEGRCVDRRRLRVTPRRRPAATRSASAPDIDYKCERPAHFKLPHRDTGHRCKCRVGSRRTCCDARGTFLICLVEYPLYIGFSLILVRDINGECMREHILQGRADGERALVCA